MRLTLSLLFMATLLAALLAVLVDTIFEQESLSQTATSRVGSEFVWPDDPHLADPGTALRVLTEAADATSVNVLRTSVNTPDTGPEHITHYVLLTRDRSALFDEFSLAEGRWPSRDESRTGTAMVSSVGRKVRRNRGSRRIGGGYDLTIAPLDRAFDTLPARGQVCGGDPHDPATVRRFVDRVHRG